MQQIGGIAEQPVVGIGIDPAIDQSFRVFLLYGMTVHLVGDATDCMGKRMKGGCVTVVPHAGAVEPGIQVILGNRCLCGATGGAQ